MKLITMLTLSLGLALGAAACDGGSTSTHVNAVTGDTCDPDPQSYMPRKPAPDHCQGTSNGDNCDDLHSGKIDCIGDGNSGQGDDKKHNCEFPQPGCDEHGCCEPDIVDPPPTTPPSEPPTTEPPPSEPPSEPPPPQPIP